VYASDYVLAEYGTDAIMAVPAHDRRDFDFAHALGGARLRPGNGELQLARLAGVPAARHPTATLRNARQDWDGGKP
jgi:hypothetical protein